MFHQIKDVIFHQILVQLMKKFVQVWVPLGRGCARAGGSVATVVVASASQTGRRVGASKRHHQPIQLMFVRSIRGVAARNAIEYVTWLSLSHSESAIPLHGAPHPPPDPPCPSLFLRRILAARSNPLLFLTEGESHQEIPCLSLRPPDCRTKRPRFAWLVSCPRNFTD